jgi:hypothetical protein
LTQSLQVYRYNLCPTIAEVRIKLGSGKSIAKEGRDKSSPTGEKIPFMTTFSGIIEYPDTPQRIGCKVTYEFQQKIPHRENEYQMWTPEAYFFIVPQHKIIIIHGSADVRSKILEKIEEVLGGGGTIEVLPIKKESMEKLVEKIRTQDSRNRISVQRDEQERVNLNDGIETLVYKMHKGKCASTVKKIVSDKKKSSSYDCKLGIVKCTGLLDGTLPEEVTLTITRSSEFRLSTDRNAEKWNKFILEQCKMIF